MQQQQCKKYGFTFRGGWGVSRILYRNKCITWKSGLQWLLVDILRWLKIFVWRDLSERKSQSPRPDPTHKAWDFATYTFDYCSIWIKFRGPSRKAQLAQRRPRTRPPWMKDLCYGPEPIWKARLLIILLASAVLAGHLTQRTFCTS